MAKMLYVIGDIHGRFDLLRKADAAISDHLGRRTGKVVCLGDYVDRGPQSFEVVEYLIEAQKSRDFTCLMGNHEMMMLQACREGGRALEQWLTFGGDATLQSYGVSALSEKEIAKIPETHLTWMDDLPIAVFDAHRVYVHAGLMPGVPLAEQSEESCLWIREKFLRAKAGRFPDGKHIVHGHTIAWAGKPDPSRAELLAHRTNLDTAAYQTGVLTVGVFYPEIHGGPVETLTIREEEAV